MNSVPPKDNAIVFPVEYLQRLNSGWEQAHNSLAVGNLQATMEILQALEVQLYPYLSPVQREDVDKKLRSARNILSVNNWMKPAGADSIARNILIAVMKILIVVMDAKGMLRDQQSGR